MYAQSKLRPHKPPKLTDETGPPQKKVFIIWHKSWFLASRFKYKASDQNETTYVYAMRSVDLEENIT